jgi:hypothetical protein
VKGQSKATMIAKVPAFPQETVSSILGIEPDEECLDWICYRVRGGRDPAGDAPFPPSPAASVSPPGGRPGRDDIQRALGHLVSLGMLTCASRRWSITARGHAAIMPPLRGSASEVSRAAPPVTTRAADR